MITRDLNHLFVTKRRILHLHRVPSQTLNGHAAAKPASTGRAASAASLSPVQPQKSTVSYRPLQNLLILPFLTKKLLLGVHQNVSSNDISLVSI